MMNLVTSDSRVKVTLHAVEEPDEDNTDSEMSPPLVLVHAQGSATSGAQGGAGAAKSTTPDVGQLQKELAGVAVKDEGIYRTLLKFTESHVDPFI